MHFVWQLEQLFLILRWSLQTFCWNCVQALFGECTTSQKFDRGAVPANRPIGFIAYQNKGNELKKSICGAKVTAKVSQRQLHSLAIMLISSEILLLHVTDPNKTWKDNILPKDLSIETTKSSVAGEDSVLYKNLAISDLSYWEGLQLK